MKEFTNAFKRITLSIALFAVMAGLPAMLTQAADADGKDDSKIVIVHSNDAHCNINRTADADKDSYTLGYECMAGIIDDEKDQYSNVTVADAGDHIQGNPIGILTKGQAIIEIMNEVGFDVSTLGNHEFDYGLDTLKQLTDQADYEYVSCNFIENSTNETVYKPYWMKSYETSVGNVNIAYVGVTTPETITRTSADTFQDEDGNALYNFCQDKTGKELYDCVQNAVDTARADGADYVIIVGHLGQDGVEEAWRSDSIVKNTTGVDAVIDGHSHEKYIQWCENKEGEKILIAQTGAQLNNVGVMTLDVETGTFSEEVLEANVLKENVRTDENVKKKVEDVNDELSEILQEKVGETSVNLYATEDDDWTWVVRANETNMGDLLCDAFKNVLNADVSIIGGGGIRHNIYAGDVTYNDLLSVQPFGNDTSVIKATGQQIKDALEMGAYKYPQDSGAFMQVSGISYEINTSVTPSNVVLDDNGYFVRVDGRYRVQNIKINGQPIDLNKEYTVSGSSFTLLSQGDGLSMFKGCEQVVTTGPKDFEVFATYVRDYLKGSIGTGYENKYGEGRIKFVTDTTDATEDDTKEDTKGDTKTTAKQVLIAKGSAKKNSITYTWNSIENASYYKVYFARCGNKAKQVAKVTKSSYTRKNLKAGKGYLAYVIAYDKNGKQLKKSLSIHLTTLKGPRANITKLSIKKTKASIKKGNKITLKASISKKDANKTMFGKNHVSATIRYISSDSSIATVSAKGVVTAKKAGTCYVYAVAPSGAHVKVVITVR